MTLLRLKVRQALRLLKIGNCITCTWPHEPGAGKLVFVLREIDHGLSVLIVISVLIATLFATYREQHDLITMMKAASQSLALFEVLCNLILCKLQSTRIQHLLLELKDSLRTFNDHERIILQQYINRYTNVYTFIAIWHAIAIIVFSCGPIFLPLKFPAETYYPFPTESLITTSILYATQVYSIALAGFGISMDFMFSMFFCYSAARLEMLWLEIQNVKSKMQIKYYIKKHQEIIEYVDKARHVVRHVLFKTNITMGLGIICAAFPLLHTQSGETSFQFVCIVLGAYQRLYITAWPADDLKQNSEQLAFELYNAPWLERSRSVIRDMCFMIQRSQKPLVISMGGLLPILSLEYYLKYATSIFSYFTTMRAVLDS